MSLSDFMRQFGKEDWYGYAGATACPDGTGPWISLAKLRHEDQVEEVEMLVCGDEVNEGKYVLALELSQGEGISWVLDGRPAEDRPGATELAKDGLSLEQVEALARWLHHTSEVPVARLFALGFEEH